MKNLVYDSLYKFLVSLGIILIVFPIVAFVFLYNAEPVLISQEDYNLLSETSKNVLSLKDYLSDTILKLPSWVLIVPMLLGIVALGFGLIWWRKTQKKLDEKLDEEVKKAKLESKFQQMTNQEKEEKIRNKVEVTILEPNSEKNENSKNDNDHNEDAEEKHGSDPDQTPDSSSSSAINPDKPYTDIDESGKSAEREEKEQDDKKNPITDPLKEFYQKISGAANYSTYAHVEDLFYAYLKKMYASYYAPIQRDMRINNLDYDIIGLSKDNDVDLVGQVMYFKDSHKIPQRLRLFAERTRRTIEDYKKTTNRTQRYILLIVTDNEISTQETEKYKMLFQEYNGSSSVELVFMDLKTLEKLAKD
ncbi:hypothetical protein JRC49_03215 [Clostridiales bacterium FE2011]|nr:hypothetical protein JRC49_03215 [Clostridiales bacterium FE2011]